MGWQGPPHRVVTSAVTLLVTVTVTNLKGWWWSGKWSFCRVSYLWDALWAFR